MENAKNSLAFSDSRLITLAGLEDTLVVETQDAVLIAKKGDSQEVRKLKERNYRASRNGKAVGTV